MATDFQTRTARTLSPTFSFYVSSSSEGLIRDCAASADAVVVHGRDGPQVVEAMRRHGFDGVVLFDRANYERSASSTPPGAWLEAQTRAGADRLLTGGHWVEWDRSGDELRLAVDAARDETRSIPGVTLVLAIDSRWLTTSDGLYNMIAILKDVPEPVALVLSHRDDPLGSMTAVNNLLALTTNVPGLTFLRSDHGAIGALTIGARHGSVGLMVRYRHFVPPSVTGGGRAQDRTARVFVWDLMDWFTGFTIAGWGATGVDITCKRECCDGESLARFFDERLNADAHNRTVLAALGNYVLLAEPEDRRSEFSRLC
ncbi:MAG: hypothetical protein QOD63_2249, partial [Actinomycetota bacterium]|nr:hypothetical protein [Actinomycetota bacterium]